jgi:hypothetical protein
VGSNVLAGKLADRNSGIPATVSKLVRELVQLRSEFGEAKSGNPDLVLKHDAAIRAFALGNDLFDELTIWAQAHVTGHAMLDDMSDLKAHLEDDFGTDFDKAPHFRERLGSVFYASSASPAGDALERSLGKFQKNGSHSNEVDEGHATEIVSDKALRTVAVAILGSGLSLSMPWRAVLADGLKSLDDGQVPTIFQNPKTPRQHRPSDRKYLQIKAIKHVWYQVGTGKAVGEAREHVSNSIVVGAETLRKWEREFRKSNEMSNEFDCSEIAGEIGSLFNTIDLDSAEFIQKYGVFRGTPKIENAFWIYFNLMDFHLELIRTQLLKLTKKR